MKSEEREYILYLEDMLESIYFIAEYIENLNFDSFKRNRKTADAVVRNLEIIGEAAKNIPQTIKEENIEMPWRQMYGLRNLIIHKYFGLDYEIIWDIVYIKLPKNKLKLEDITSNIKNNNII